MTPIMTLIKKYNIVYRFQQLAILLLHLILLKWMHYTLTQTGRMPTKIVFAHFAGMALYGGLLIRGCAAWGKYHYERNAHDEG